MKYAFLTHVCSPGPLFFGGAIRRVLQRNVRPASAQPVKIAIVGTNPTMAGKLVALFQHVAAAEEQILDGEL